VVLAAAFLLAGCSDDATSRPTTTTTAPAGGLTADQRRRADQLVSVFENSTTELQYGYAEDLGDGRGITSGRAGFTTRTCDALDVVERYGEAPLARYLPELERLCAEDSDDTAGLAGYVGAWAEAAEDPAFRHVQDEVVDETYFLPAMALADDLGLETAVARVALYDAAIQHGIGEDADGLPAMIERTGPVDDEADWLAAFSAERLATLRHPADATTAAEWRESTDRVRCLQSIADAGNEDLDGPLRCTVYGDDFTID
jgi:chitosanase